MQRIKGLLEPIWDAYARCICVDRRRLLLLWAAHSRQLRAAAQTVATTHNQSISILQIPSSVTGFSVSFRSCLQLYAHFRNSDVRLKVPTDTDPCLRLSRLMIRSGLQVPPRSKAVPSSKCLTNPVNPSNSGCPLGPIQHRTFRGNPVPCDIRVQAHYCRAPKHPQ